MPMTLKHYCRQTRHQCVFFLARISMGKHYVTLASSCLRQVWTAVVEKWEFVVLTHHHCELLPKISKWWEWEWQTDSNWQRSGALKLLNVNIHNDKLQNLFFLICIKGAGVRAMWNGCGKMELLKQSTHSSKLYSSILLEQIALSYSTFHHW